jgi:hypothetical protein
MINDILLSMKARIELALQAAQDRDDDWISFCNLFGLDGNPADELSGKIVMSVASLQTDASVGTFSPPRAGPGGSFPVTTAPLYLDAYVLFVSCFTGQNYPAGLGILSRIASYLQENPVFEAAESPEIGDRMGKLAIEYASLDFAQAAHLSSLMGIKSLPFLLYRLRRLPFAGPAISAVAPAVERAPPARAHPG